MFKVLLWEMRSNVQTSDIAALAGLKTICLKGAQVHIEYLGTVEVLKGFLSRRIIIRYSGQCSRFSASNRINF